MRRIASVPDTKDLRHLSEMVDVPVGAARRLQVMFDACTQAPRAERAAKVEIKWRVKVDTPKAPNLQFDRRPKLKKKRVRSLR